MVRIKRTWSDNDLINIVGKSKCLSDVIDSLGLVRGGSYKSIKFHISRLKLDTSHFSSKKDLSNRSKNLLKNKSKEKLFVANGSYNDYKLVKKLIIKDNLLEYKCHGKDCGISEWIGKKLNLQMDHINGIKTDNRLENLRFLCPNCHSLTDNFCGKNRKSEKRKPNQCIVCKIEIHRSSIWCVSCKRKNTPTKIKWPAIDELIDMTQKFGYVECGRRLGVSDNAVRKHIKMGLSPNGMVAPS